MRSALALFGFALIAVSGLSETGPAIPADLRVTAFTNGSWFDGHSFKKRTGYAVGEALSFRRPPHVDAVVDLKVGFVVPPFGEAHNHNVEPLNRVDGLIQRYLNHGIFYIKDPDNLPNGRDRVLPKVNQPESIDVIFSNGGFTGSNGHPSESVKRNVDHDIWAQADGDGAFYYAVDNPADLERKWPQFPGHEAWVRQDLSPLFRTLRRTKRQRQIRRMEGARSHLARAHRTEGPCCRTQSFDSYRKRG